MRQLAICVLIVLGALVSACTSQDKHIVPVSTTIPSPPPTSPLSEWKEGPDRTRITLQSDGATLRGWKYQGSDPRMPCVLFFYGNAMTISASDLLYRRIAAAGPNVLVYDYRGYGFSDGKPDLMKIREDALRIFDAHADGEGSNGLIVTGYSLGTAVAAYVAANRKAAGLILVSPTSSAADMLPGYLRRIGVPADKMRQFIPSDDLTEAVDIVRFVAHSQAPIIIFHSDHDEILPLEQAKKVYESSISSHKRLIVLPGLLHTQMFNGERIYDEIHKFAESLIG